MRLRLTILVVVSLAVCCVGGADACAQNPVQWSGSVDQSVSRAQAQSLPLLFWVTGERDRDNDDLNDAQEECFRDPVVVSLIHDRFVPVRVSRNSRVIESAERLGLPTEHGLYCAVLTPDGELLERMGPGEVADPERFAGKLVAASDEYLAGLYDRELRPVLEDLSSSKKDARHAAQTVWRLGITRADSALVGLLDRPDLTPSERARIYGALAAFGTQTSIDALLDRSDDDDAARALMKAEPGALEWLLPAMPAVEGEVTSRQLLAYRAVIRVSRQGGGKGDSWWGQTSSEARAHELERVGDRARAVLEYWKQSRAG